MHFDKCNFQVAKMSVTPTGSISPLEPWNNQSNCKLKKFRNFWWIVKFCQVARVNFSVNLVTREDFEVFWYRPWPPGPSRGSTTSLLSSLCKITAKPGKNSWKLGGQLSSITARKTASPLSTFRKFLPLNCSITRPLSADSRLRPFRYTKPSI